MLVRPTGRTFNTSSQIATSRASTSFCGGSTAADAGTAPRSAGRSAPSSRAASYHSFAIWLSVSVCGRDAAEAPVSPAGRGDSLDSVATDSSLAASGLAAPGVNSIVAATSLGKR